ncbi:MAG: hypothetical protein JKY08_07545 [Flavobacteriaceae bacterium]|nr:hypothetical protein [Flavobacteriaceae bacterium]
MAESQLSDLKILKESNSMDTNNAHENQQSLLNKLEITQLLEAKFDGLNEHFDEFKSFITSDNLTPQELQAFLHAVENDYPKIKRDFRKNGYPKNHEEFTIFADNFGIETTAEQSENKEIDLEKIKAVYVTYHDKLEKSDVLSQNGLSEYSQLLENVTSAKDIKNLEGNIEKLNTYLIGTDGKS